MSDAAPILAEIHGALARGDAAGATALACRALDDGLRHPALLRLRAERHLAAGRLAQARADMIAAVELAPRDAALHHQLGFVEEQAGALDRAGAAFETARRLDPDLTDATARLASLAARRGDHAQARALADEVLARQPRHATAQFSLILCDLAERRFAEAERRARAVAADPQMVPMVRANAASFAADALDGQGRFAEAFDCYGQANALLQAVLRTRFAGRETGLPLAERFAAELAALPPWPASPPLAPLPARGIVFVVGFPRSGTTLLGQVLGAHSAVVAVEEKPLLAQALAEFAQAPGGLARLAAADAATVARHRAAYFEALRAEGVEAADRVVVDQTPLHLLHLPIVARLFPESRVVFALRDPRDVVLSCFRRLFAPNPYVYEFLTLDGAARFYDATMRFAGACRARLPLPVYDIRNEALVADFPGETARLCAFLGLAYEDAMRDFAARSRPIATPSAMQLAQGLSSESVNHWRNYEAGLAPVASILNPWVERFGYA